MILESIVGSIGGNLAYDILKKIYSFIKDMIDQVPKIEQQSGIVTFDLSSDEFEKIYNKYMPAELSNLSSDISILNDKLDSCSDKIDDLFIGLSLQQELLLIAIIQATISINEGLYQLREAVNKKLTQVVATQQEHYTLLYNELNSTKERLAELERLLTPTKPGFLERSLKAVMVVNEYVRAFRELRSFAKEIRIFMEDLKLYGDFKEPLLKFLGFEDEDDY